jgi:hypothetical protein
MHTHTQRKTASLECRGPEPRTQPGAGGSPTHKDTHTHTLNEKMLGPEPRTQTQTHNEHFSLLSAARTHNEQLLLWSTRARTPSHRHTHTHKLTRAFVQFPLRGCWAKNPHKPCKVERVHSIPRTHSRESRTTTSLESPNMLASLHQLVFRKYSTSNFVLFGELYHTFAGDEVPCAGLARTRWTPS